MQIVTPFLTYRAKNMIIDRTRCLIFSGITGAAAVVLGAFGAHGLEDTLSEKMMEVYQTGVLYHLIHAIALLALSFAPDILWASKWAGRIATAWLLGIILFSVSLYALAITGIGPLGAITPFGGLAFITGWVMVTFLRNHEA
jgi:uncharacterized membrane protein YgdD (TMEM256/DUF423 family)